MLAQNGYWISATSFEDLPEQYRVSEYGSWVRDRDWFHSLIAATLIGRDGVSLNFARGHLAKAFEPDALALLHRLIPHVKRVLQIHKENQTLRAFFDAGQAALDHFDVAMIGLDESARVTLVTPRAEIVLKRHPGVVVRDDRLVCRNSSESSRLNQFLRPASMTGGAAGIGGAITIHNTEGLNSLSLIITPLRSSRILAGGQPCALVFLYDPAEKPTSRSTTLRLLFELTPAECRLAAYLHQGLELRTIAENMGVTETTARFMLKRIFQKTGTHRQAQLIRLLTIIPGDAK